MINKLLNIDCMVYMKDIPDNYFDLAIVDPPYGIGENPSRALGRSRSSKKWRNAKPVIYKGNDWDNERPPAIYFKELFRVSEEQIIWGGNYFVEYLKSSMGWVAWYKKGQTPNADFSDCEFAYTSFWRASKLFNFPWIGFGAVNAKEKRIHPTQKPVALYKWLLKNYAKPGWKLFDSHSGSGSFRIAAYDMGFDLISCEIDKDYCKDNEARFQNHIKQAELFDSKEIQELTFDRTDD